MIVLKKHALAGVMASALVMLSSGSQAATDSATVNITATVVDNTCTPEWTGAVQVAMGRASARDFTGEGSVGATNTFHLKMKDCGSGTTKVKVKATGTADANTDLFKNEDASGAAGVALAIFGDASQSTQLKPNSGEAEYDITGNATPDLAFKAELRQSGTAAPTTGDVKSAITLTITYE